MTIIIFGLDGIITARGILPLIGGYFNVEKELDILTEETLQGNVPFTESLIKRMFILGKLPITEISQLLAKAVLHEQVINFIQEHKDNCVIATGNPACWVEKLLNNIGCAYYASTGAVIDDKFIKIEKILKKESVVQRYQNAENKVVFIGNGNSDMEAMRVADRAVASGLIRYPSKSILPFSDYLIFNETALCRLLNQLL
jgi:phosphoserine phosphatase